MDGIPEVHDYYRKAKSGKKTSHILERNIKLLVNNGVTTCIRSTIGKKNINTQKESIDYFDGLGVKAIFADHLCLPVKNNAKKFGKNLVVEVHPLDYVKKFLEAKKYAESKDIFYSNFLCVNFDEPVDIACRAMIPAPHLTPDGYVSCCDMATKPDSALGDLIYGKYDKASKKNNIFPRQD